MIENFRMKKSETYEAAIYRIDQLIKDYTKMGDDCNTESFQTANDHDGQDKGELDLPRQARIHCHAKGSE